MIYKFRSKATGDVIMLGPNGDHMLQLIGKAPAPTGIVEPKDMPAAMAALERAVAEEEALRAQAASQASAAGQDDTSGPRTISLRQRVWPMVEMMRRASAAGEPIVWGV